MLRDELYEALLEIPVLDVHTHVNRDRMAAWGLEQVLFYHMQMYPMAAAGVEEDRMWPEVPSIERGLPFDQWLECWPRADNTGFAWILKTILRDLYGFDEPLTGESFPRLKEAFEARTSRPDWPREVFRKANVARIASSHLDVAPLAAGEWDGDIRFTVESAPLVNKTEYVTWTERLRTLAESTGREVASVAAMREALDAFYDRFDWSGKSALVCWLGSRADFRPVPDAQIDRLLAAAARGETLDPDASALVEAAYVRSILRAARERVGVFQFCYGTQYVTAEPLWAHPILRAHPDFASSMGYLFGEFPDLHFNVLNGYEPDEPIWCAMVQGYRNVSLSGFWWHTFYPSVMHRAVSRRLDMAPQSRLVGFFSDGWCVDYVYGRLAMARRVWANVLTEKIERGLYTRDHAMAVARQVFFETPRRLFFPNERFDV